MRFQLALAVIAAVICVALAAKTAPPAYPCVKADGAKDEACMKEACGCKKGMDADMEAKCEACKKDMEHKCAPGNYECMVGACGGPAASDCICKACNGDATCIRRTENENNMKCPEEEEKSNVKEVSTIDEFKKALTEAGDELVVVDFTATWCPPCMKIAPTFEKFSQEFSNVVFLKVDVDKNVDAAKANNIKAMPTFLFFKKGNKVAQMKGADAKKLEQMIKNHK